MLAENLQTVRENADIFIKASNDIGLEVNSEKTKYVITSRHENVIQNQNIVIRNLWSENVEKFRYLGVTVTNTNDIRDEIKRSMNKVNAYYSLKNCSLRASAANTPTTTTPEDVSHSRGRNVEGKET